MSTKFLSLMGPPKFIPMVVCWQASVLLYLCFWQNASEHILQVHLAPLVWLNILFPLFHQNAPHGLRNISSKVAQSQSSCRVVATVLVLTLYIAAIGNFVSTATSDMCNRHFHEQYITIHFMLQHDLVPHNRSLPLTREFENCDIKLKQRQLKRSNPYLLVFSNMSLQINIESRFFVFL